MMLWYTCPKCRSNNTILTKDYSRSKEAIKFPFVMKCLICGWSYDCNSTTHENVLKEIERLFKDVPGHTRE